jgi:hypothetical protein
MPPWRRPAPTPRPPGTRPARGPAGAEAAARQAQQEIAGAQVAASRDRAGPRRRGEDGRPVARRGCPRTRRTARRPACPSRTSRTPGRRLAQRTRPAPRRQPRHQHRPRQDHTARSAHPGPLKQAQARPSATSRKTGRSAAWVKGAVSRPRRTTSCWQSLVSAPTGFQPLGRLRGTGAARSPGPMQTLVRAATGSRVTSATATELAAGHR